MAEYLQRCLKWTFTWFSGAQLMMAVIVGLSILAGLGGIGFALWNRDWAWLLGLIPFGVLMFICAPYFVWREEHRKVTEYEKVDLELVAKNDGQYIYQRGDNWIFRVGVRTHSRKSVNNIQVVIKARNGREHTFSDAPLSPAYSLPGDSSFFLIKPDEVKFVEVCSWGKGDAEISVHYHTRYQIILHYYDEKYPNKVPPQMVPFVLPAGIPINETITLCATGDNVQSVSKTLRINTSGKPLWEEVE